MSERGKNLGVIQILCRDDDKNIKTSAENAEYLSMTRIPIDECW